MILSAKHLPRDLRIFGVIGLIFGLIFATRDFLLVFLFLFSSIILFSLAAGISKKEKWAWFFGTAFFILTILGNFLGLFLGQITFVNLIIYSIVPTLFLITFIKAKQEIALEKKVSVIPLALLIIALIGGIVLAWYLSSGGYKQKQEESRQEQFLLQLCDSTACRTSVQGDNGIFYYDYLGEKFDSREGCINYCIEQLRTGR